MVKKNHDVFEYIDRSLKKDKKFILKAVKLLGNFLAYADKNLKKDKKIVLEAAKSMKKWRKILKKQERISEEKWGIKNS